MRRRLVSACLVAASLGGTPPAWASPPLPPTPTVRWQLGFPGWGEPAADDDAAYFLTRNHEVLSVDAATGGIRWRIGTGGTGDVPSGTHVRLTVDQVFVGDGGIVAVDRVSGRRRWRFDAPDGDDAGVFLGAADTDLVLAGSPAGRVYAVDASSGVLRWRRDVTDGERRVVFPPIRLGSLVVASFTTFDGPLRGGVIGLDPHGRRRWVRHFDGAGAAGPPVAGGGLVFVSRTDGRIEALHAATGARRFSLAPESSAPTDAHARDIRALASAGDVVVATSLRGPLRAYDIRSRRLRWAYASGPPDAVALRIRVFGSRVYVPYSDGSLAALDLRTGRECWRADSNRSFDWPPVATRTAIFASGADAIWALHADPGDAGIHVDPVSDSH